MRIFFTNRSIDTEEFHFAYKTALIRYDKQQKRNDLKMGDTTDCQQRNNMTTTMTTTTTTMTATIVNANGQTEVKLAVAATGIHKFAQEHHNRKTI